MASTSLQLDHLMCEIKHFRRSIQLAYFNYKGDCNLLQFQQDITKLNVNLHHEDFYEKDNLKLNVECVSALLNVFSNSNRHYSESEIDQWLETIFYIFANILKSVDSVTIITSDSNSSNESNSD